MKIYVLGVDGGGTKTHYALYDTSGNRVGFLAGGIGNHEMYESAFIGLERELEKSINKIMVDNGLSIADISYSVLGLAGVDTKEQHAIISEILRRIGLEKFHLCNDGYLGIKAGSSNGYGICSINGTGTNCIGIDSKGNSMQVGGIGDISCDYAGAGKIGTFVAAKVYESLFQCGEQTIMKDMLFKKVGIDKPADYADIMSAKLGSGELDIAYLNRFAFLAANEGDKVAIDLLKYVGNRLGLSICGNISHLDFENSDTINIVLAGSVYVKGENPIMIEAMKSTVKSKVRNKLVFTILIYPPVTGAVLWALEGIGADLDDGIREKVIDNMSNHI